MTNGTKNVGPGEGRGKGWGPNLTVMAAFVQTAFGQKIRIWPGHFREHIWPNRIWPESVFQSFGSCETLAALGPPGLHTTTKELQTRTFERPGASNTIKIPRKDPKKREERKKIVAGEGKKKREFWAPSGPSLRAARPARPAHHPKKAGDAFTETRTILTVPPFVSFSLPFFFFFFHLNILDGQRNQPKLA